MLRLAIPICIAALTAFSSLPGKAAEVILEDSDLVLLPSGVRRAPSLSVSDDVAGQPIVSDAVRFPEAARKLRMLDAAGAAHGFGGILYDNRDRGHSRLPGDVFPRLAHLSYGVVLQAENADYGLAGAMILPAVVFGNSSTAITGGWAARSLPRLAMTADGLAQRMARLHDTDHLYIYPEHRDHDDADLFPANWTYTLTSQGSSGSDQPFLEAIAMTLAAFRPDTFSRLREERLVAPTIQMILRRTLVPVVERDDYFTGAAHPVAFDAAQLRPARMVELAAAMPPEAIPPRVRISVIDEDFSAEAGLARLDERLFDTPAAIARVWRGFAHEREMVVSAEGTSDPNGRPLTFTWSLLQGDPKRVRIEPLDAEGRRARIVIAWHDPFPSASASRPTTSRVDIGVFASNGETDSAPAFVSVSFPTHQVRDYEADAAGGMRLAAIDYDAATRAAYFDPYLHWSAPWRDEAIHDQDGEITAWRRVTDAGEATIVPASPDGVGYRIDMSRPRTPLLRTVP